MKHFKIFRFLMGVFLISILSMNTVVNAEHSISSISSVEESFAKDNLVHNVSAYFYTVDNSQESFLTAWDLSTYKYPEGFESGTITYGELLDGLDISHVIPGEFRGDLKDIIHYISEVTNGQMTLEEFEQKTGSSLTPGDLETLSPYTGYSLSEVDFQNNLSQIIIQTDPSQGVSLGVPFIKNNSKTAIHYVMEDGTPAFEDRVIEGVKGYTPDMVIESPLKEGYVADPQSVLVHMDGEQEITVTYKIPPIKGGNVVAQYVDESNNSISEDVVYSGNIGEDYSTTAKDIEGYTLKEVQGTPEGQFTDQAQTVTYIYTKNKVAAGDITNETHLPDTGESKSMITIISGLVLVLLTGSVWIGYTNLDRKNRGLNRLH